MTAETLTDRRLGRALLARQWLLERSPATTVAAIEQVAGLQAQVAAPPFVGLWSRVAGFRRQDLLDAIHDRRVIRATMMRGTIHHVSRRDYVEYRTTLQPVLDRVLQNPGPRRVAHARDALVPLARRLLHDEPRTIAALRDPLHDAHPDLPADDLAMVARMLIPLAMVPDPDASDGYPGNARFALAEDLLDGEPLSPVPDPAGLLRRYLAAFGPATAADAAKWSGLQGVRAVLDAMDDLDRYRDERGRDLFDVSGALLPDEDVPAPVRFLPRFDNLILSHADPARVIADEHKKGLVTRNGIVEATFLWDGVVAGVWDVGRRRGRAALRITPLRRLPQRAQATVRAEGRRLLGFVAPDATGYEVLVD
ncbi:MAG: winged helix DNA-binding domain-containing protein [Solirubrobacteraceae bacterium]